MRLPSNGVFAISALSRGSAITLALISSRCAATGRPEPLYVAPSTDLKLEHLVPTERKAFRHGFRARMRAEFSQQGLDVEFHRVKRDAQTTRDGLVAQAIRDGA